MTVLDYARRYLDAGISIIPIRRGGDKEPASDLLPWVWDEDRAINRRSWKPFQDEPVTLTEAVSWWRSAAPPGIAAVGGAISGGLEVLDFDRLAEELFAGWCEMVEAEHPGLVGRLCVVQTPRQPAGYHVWLRCPDIETPGNTKLAIDPTVKGKERTLIETRGKGGYALVPGCPPECHPSGGTYEHVAGPALWDLGTVSMDEHEDLMSCARALSREVQEEHSPSHAHPSNGELLPGQDFDRRGPDWSEILTPHGWTLAGKAQGGERRWRRPGKEDRKSNV